MLLGKELQQQQVASLHVRSEACAALVALPVNQQPAAGTVGHAPCAWPQVRAQGQHCQRQRRQDKDKAHAQAETTEEHGKDGQRSDASHGNGDPARGPVVKRDGGCGFHR